MRITRVDGAGRVTKGAAFERDLCNPIDVAPVVNGNNYVAISLGPYRVTLTILELMRLIDGHALAMHKAR